MGNFNGVFGEQILNKPAYPQLLKAAGYNVDVLENGILLNRETPSSGATTSGILIVNGISGSEMMGLI